jgi:hypothetical protein
MTVVRNIDSTSSADRPTKIAVSDQDRQMTGVVGGFENLSFHPSEGTLEQARYREDVPILHSFKPL